MVKLANDKNVDQLLMELKEYFPLQEPLLTADMPRKSTSTLSAEQSVQLASVP